jgi:hypothetical protein
LFLANRHNVSPLRKRGMFTNVRCPSKYSFAHIFGGKEDLKKKKM